MKYIIAIISFVVIGCSGYEPLLTKRANYSGNQLKIDGYYYFLTKEDMGYGYTTKIYDCLMLFNNGIYYNISHGGYNPNLGNDSILIKLDNDIKGQVKRQNDNLNYRPHWGVFNITGSKIEIERWVTASGAGAYPTQILKGEIKNDTTIYFHTLVGAHPVNMNNKKKTKTIDETYHFRQFLPKPDSTNKFIK
jgi:hypothetical protein